jgi:hypothetical protein
MNLETGETFTEPSKHHHWQVIQQLELTDAQQLRIAYAADLFKRLLDPVLQELRQLQQKQLQSMDPINKAAAGDSAARDALPDTDCPNNSAAATRTAAGGSSTCQSSSDPQLDLYADMPHPYNNRARLDLQAQRSDRLTCVMRKEEMLRSAAIGVTYGCLSWRQLAQLMVRGTGG